MTPEQLKISILRYAIQGKLVEQRKEEGNAEKLYQEIQEERYKLIKLGKIKRDKFVANSVDVNASFSIPDSWKWCCLGELFSHMAGKALNAKNTKGKKYKYITTSNVYWDHFELTNLKEMYYTEDELEKYSVNYGDLLVLEGGDVGRSAIWNLKERYCIQNHIHRLRPFRALCVKYFYYVMMYLKYKGNISGKGIGIKGLSAKALKCINVPLPPLEEQYRIVAKIEELFSFVKLYEISWAKIDDLNRKFPEKLKKAILQDAIQGKLSDQIDEDGSGKELIEKIIETKSMLIKTGQLKKRKVLSTITESDIPFSIPDTWQWARLGELVELNPKNDLIDDSEVAFVPMACIMDGYRNVHLQESRVWKTIKKGFTHFADNDIAIAKITPCFQNRKSVILQDLKSGFGAGTTEVSVVRVIENLLFHKYLLWFFKSEYFISAGVRSFTGTAGQQRIHKDFLSQCLIPIPPLNEQKRIVEKIEKIFQLIEQEKHMI